MKILVAYDGSDAARRALDRAAQLAGDGSSLGVVTVAFGVPDKGRTPGYTDPDDAAVRRQDAEDARALLGQKGIDAHVVEAYADDAAEGIIDEAERQQADLIVLGTRGRGTAARWLLGSVSTKVLQHAPCDVLVVR
jgi:nucleotide-binding universal stress UspA family protein